MGYAKLSALILCLSATARGEDAAAIMQKVAANTDAAAEARRQYVYHQRVRSSLLRSNGQVVCRETREYTVVPRPKTTKKKLVSFSGECLQGKQMVPYQGNGQATVPGVEEKGIEVDGHRESIAGVINDLANDPKSRDGIPRQLFPLSGGEVEHYRFSLKGETTVKGRRAFDILFEPALPKAGCGDDACRPWKGEAWIDAEDYQPIRVDTELFKGVPWGVRVFMGINIRQLGFSLTYQRVAAGVWFPATYGAEFQIQLFWGFKRTITLSIENSDFLKTDAQSTIQFDPPDQ